MKQEETLKKVNKSEKKLGILLIIFGILILFIILMFFINLNSTQTPIDPIGIIPSDIITEETNTNNPTGNSTDIFGFPGDSGFPFGFSMTTWIGLIVAGIIFWKFIRRRRIF